MSEIFSDKAEAGADTGITENGLSVAGVICPHEDLASLARSIVEKGGILRFQAHGASMFPLIQDGDIVQVRAAGSVPPAIGDILLTQGAMRTVKVHRLIAMSRKGESQFFTTMGDNSFTSDDPVSFDEVIGRVVAASRGRVTPDLESRGSRWAAVFMCHLGILHTAVERKKNACRQRRRSLPAETNLFAYRLAGWSVRLTRRFTLLFLMKKARI